MKTIHWILVVFVAVWLGFLFGFIVAHRSNAKVKNLEAQLRNKELKLKNDEVAVERSKKEAEAIINSAKKEAEGYILRGENELFKLYPNLEKFKPGHNAVNKRYIKSFWVRGNKIKIEMHNATRDNIGPDANIIFLNKQGFVTKNYTLLWVFSRIKPGETRFDEGNVEFKYGEPVYYSVEFDDSGSSGGSSGYSSPSNKPSPAHAPAPGISADVTYSIIDSDTFLDYKRSLDVRLNKKVSEETLRAIALKLKAQDSRNYERTFICYYLPDMEVGAGAWATTHFNPNLDVRILGLTAEQEETLKQQPDDPSREVIGSWLDESPFIGSRITIFRQNGKLFIENTYKDGSSGKKEIVEKLSGKDRTFRRKEGSSVGEFYLIDNQGNLQMWDEEGIISTARKIGD